ncbi:UNVERIFIED_CONTAM: Beta-fructofuranosidase, insoluble isoenzyme 1 [Sesamum radiatum]|uniref:Beta-fructofuranosidase, insoluble isoenzyme 1 n=1 Tax=Sesamum radiatum TaxID=300843 RepID=A0AAW2R4G9_SESRA
MMICFFFMCPGGTNVFQRTLSSVLSVQSKRLSHSPLEISPLFLYTGIVDDKQTQVQNYAVQHNVSDPYLREWIKPDDNPLIVADNEVNKTAFRDPTTAWLGKDGEWRITIGGRKSDHRDGVLVQE